MERRVALDHPEWDLAAYSGVDLDFWEVEPPAAEETPDGEETRSTEEVVGETVVVTIDPPTDLILANFFSGGYYNCPPKQCIHLLMERPLGGHLLENPYWCFYCLYAL